MLGKTGLSLATSPYPFGYELSRFFLFQFSTINFFFFSFIVHSGHVSSQHPNSTVEKEDRSFVREGRQHNP